MTLNNVLSALSFSCVGICPGAAAQVTKWKLEKHRNAEASEAPICVCKAVVDWHWCFRNCWFKSGAELIFKSDQGVTWCGELGLPPFPGEKHQGEGLNLDLVQH